MSSSNPPATNAARTGSGEIDLSAMLAAHDAFRRDLALLARTATPGNLADPRQRAAVLAGWAVFQHQLFLHHRGEDTFLWPAMREKMTGHGERLSILDAMAAEHAQIEPLVAEVDAVLADPGATAERLQDATGELITRVSLHLGHEERDALPLIGEVLTPQDWAAIVAALRAAGTIEDAAEMVPWILLGLPPERAAQVMAFYPPIVGQKYESEWKPRFDAVPKWTA